MGKLTLHPPAGASVAFDKDEVSVGRDPQSDLVVPDGSVSRRHARVMRRGAGWAVVDQGSANGTFVDSHRVSDATLRSGQELRFGAMPFRVEIDEGSDEAASTMGRDQGVTVMQPLPLSAPTPAIAPPTVPRPPASSAPPPPPPSAPRFPPRGPAVAPPVSSAPPAAKKGKGPLFWIGLGCGGCLTVVLGFVALLAGGMYFMTSGPVDAVNAQLAAVRRGDVAAAYAQWSEEARGRTSAQEFTALVESHPALKDNAAAQLWPPAGSVNRVNDRARVSGIIVSKSGAQERLVCELVQEGGAWKIASLSVEPAR